VRSCSKIAFNSSIYEVLYAVEQLDVPPAGNDWIEPAHFTANQDAGSDPALLRRTQNRWDRGVPGYQAVCGKRLGPQCYPPHLGCSVDPVRYDMMPHTFNSFLGTFPDDYEFDAPTMDRIEQVTGLRRVRFELFRPSFVRASNVRKYLGINRIFELDSPDREPGPIGQAHSRLVAEVVELLSMKTEMEQGFAYCAQLEQLEFSGFVLTDFRALLELLKVRQRDDDHESPSSSSGGILMLENCSLPGPNHPDDPDDLVAIAHGMNMGYREAELLFGTLQG